MMETMWLRLGSLTSKETVLSFISLSPSKHSCKVELEIVRFTKTIKRHNFGLMAPELISL